MKSRTVFLSLLFLAILGSARSVIAQVLLYPAEDETLRPRLFFNGNSFVVFTGDAGGKAGLKLKMGTLPGTFQTASVPFTAPSLYLRPDSLSLPIGHIYAVLTNSDSGSLAGIQAQAAADPRIVVSNAIEFIVQSQSSPTAVAPIGNEPNSAPLFRWTSVPGVPAYQIILSKTPFQVTRDAETGEISVVGANIIWRYGTKSTSAVYGSTNANSSLNLGTPPPLVVGNEYNYTILNVYDDDGNPAYTSDVFGGVVSFKYTGAATIDAPVLRSPQDNTTFYGDNTITFSWDPVANANLYTLYLFQRVTTTSGAKQEYDLPLWSTTVTNTIADYPAKGKLGRGKYLWYVSVTDAAGNGNASGSIFFNYSIDMGKIRLQAVPTQGSGNLVGLEIRASAVSGGATPTNPFIINNDPILVDSLVAGTYQFTGTKLGYADTTITVVIPPMAADGSATDVVIPLRALPAALSGSVTDQSDRIVSGATVQTRNMLTGEQKTSLTSSSGQFSISAEAGTYSVQASKAGFIPSAAVSATVAAGDQEVLATPLKIQADQATVSGTIVNDLGNPVSMATVTASPSANQALPTQTVITNASGNYSFNNQTTLSSGGWSIAASKDGFVSAPARQITLSVGDAKQLENIVLLPKANTINGTVSELIVTNGATGRVPMANVTVIARPLTGADVTAATTTTGQFSFNLKQGTYHIQASRDNYSAAPGSLPGCDITVSVGQTVTGINFTLQANPSSVSGSVTLSDGTPVSGATVLSSGGASAQTAASGAYTLSIPAGSFTLSAAKEGYGSPAPVSLAVAAGQNLGGVNFQLSPNAAVISGTVQSGGEAVAGALITAVNAANGDSSSSMASASGAFSISVQPGTWTVAAGKTGFISASTTVTVGPGQRSGGTVFSLVPNTSRIIGTVTDGSAALRNVSVAIEEVGNPSNAISTTSGADGSFTTTVTAGKSYTIRAAMLGYVSASMTTAILSSGTSASFAFTLVAAPSSVSGLVVGNLSQPLYPVKVYVVSQAMQPIDSAVTDNSGAYRFGLQAGAFTIVARAPGYLTDSVAVSLTVGQSLSGINLLLIDNFSVISGTVMNKTNGLSNALINVTGESGGATATSSADGGFLVPRLVGGMYAVKISHDGFADTTLVVSLAAGQTHQMELALVALDGKITGTLRTVSGQPVAGATVFIRSASGKSYSTISGADGSYSLAALAMDKYRISAAKTGYSSARIDSVVLTSQSLNGSSLIADFTPNALILKGRITDAGTQAGVAGASIAVSGQAGSGSALTNTNGDYLIENLAVSSYTLSVSKTGYAAATRTVSPAVADTMVATDVQLMSNSGTISGTVKNISGAALPFLVSLKAASSSGAMSTTTADVNGNFTFTNVPRDTTTVSTDFFREGYDNVSKVVAFPAAQSSVTDVAFAIEPKNGEIDGSAGVADALISLTESTGKISSRVANARPDNTFAFTLLPAGSYTLKPSKDGFTFTPASQTIMLSASQKTALAPFSAVADTGSIFVKAVDHSTAAVMPGVTISLVSADTTVIKSGTTNANGEALFSKLLAGGRTYIVRASRTGYSADADHQNLQLQTNGFVSAQFALSVNSSSLAGRVVRFGSGSAMSGVQVVTRRSTGEQFSAVTDGNGAYAFTALPGDNFIVVASKAGFRSDTVSVSLTANETKTAPRDLSLVPTTFALAGSVIFERAGVPNLTVTASSSGTYRTQTDASGAFAFSDLPVQLNADTTIYQITVAKEGMSPRSVKVITPKSQVGQLLSLAPIILPSGKVGFTVTDGVNPIEGVKVTFTPANGASVESYTPASGVFESVGTLEKGIQHLSVAKEPYLSPSSGSLSVTLESDTTKKTGLNVVMPFTLLPVGEISAADDATVTVGASVADSADTAKLYYKKESSPGFTSAPMKRADNWTFTGVIPAQFSTEKLSCYVEVKRDTVLYMSTVQTVVPSARGILSNVDFEPSLDHATLRPLDDYRITLIARDGAHAPLGAKLLDPSIGKLSWSCDTTALAITVQDTAAVIRSKGKEGVFKITLTATLNNVSVTQSFSVTVANVVLKELAIGGLPPGGEFNNATHGLQLTIGGRDTSGKSVNVGSSIQWALSPSGAGAISPSGFLTVDTTLLGKIIVRATDAITRLSEKISLNVAATIDSSRAYDLTDKFGMELHIPRAAVTAPIDLQLEDATAGGPAKKFVFVKGSGQNFTASTNLYYLSYKGDALPGDSLKAHASLVLAADSSLKYYDGERKLGLYDPALLEWTILPASPASLALDKGVAQTIVPFTGLQTSVLSRLKAQYTLLAMNQPLGLSHVAVLPNPFSPVVAPLRIGYIVNTTDQQAAVSIAIFNIRGELVRTLLDGDWQYPGRYGSKSSPKEILWDGKTNDGSLARNGRYVVQLRAKDSSGEKVELVQVVLIK
jgi:hypothetical protein